MNVYQNKYFKLQMNFSDGWSFRNWSNWKKQPASVEYLQCSDDDIPADEQGYKALFMAMLRIKESPSIISCELSMEAHWRGSGFDLEARLPPREWELNRVFEIGHTFGVKSQTLTTENDAGSFVSTRQVVIWEAYPCVWLSACISGDTPSNFEAAKSQFNRLTRLE